MWVKLLSGYEGKNKNSNIRKNSYSFWKRSKLGVYRALGTNQRYATVQKFREIDKINCAFKTKLQDLTELWFWNFSRLICSQVKLSIHALQMPFFKPIITISFSLILVPHSQFHSRKKPMTLQSHDQTLLLQIHQYQVTWTSEHSTQRWDSASRLRTIGTYLVLTFSPCARQEDHIKVSWESHTNLRNIHGTIFPINSHRPSGKATTSLPNECIADWSTIVTLEVVLLIILGAAFCCW